MSFDDFIVPGQEKIKVVGFSDDGKKKILAEMRKIYDGSPTAAQMINDWINENHRIITINSTANGNGADVNTGNIWINLNRPVIYIDNNGTAFNRSVGMGIAHELVHALTEKIDGPGHGVFLESATDYKGETVDFANKIYDELGLPQRNSYMGSEDIILDSVIPLTNGIAIDRTVFLPVAASIGPNGETTSWNYNWASTSEGEKKNLSDLLVGNNKSGDVDGKNRLNGGPGNDFLHGLGGDDTLIGGEGKDILNGDADYDTYDLTGNLLGQIDTIIDSDGSGAIVRNGQTISDSKAASPLAFGRPKDDATTGGGVGNIYYTADLQYQLQNQLPNTKGDEWKLLKNNGSGIYTPLATLRGWADRSKPFLGLSLNGPLVEGVIVKSLDVSGIVPPFVNFNAKTAPGGVVLKGSKGSSSFTGSDYGDVIYTGDGNLNYVMANGGYDIVYGGTGRDWIRGGANGDKITNDNDIVYGGSSSDMLYGGAGDDQLWGNSNNTVVVDGVTTYEFLATNANSGDRGDWISGERGDDMIFGSSARDMLFGGVGGDTIQGGAGDDLILGDGNYGTGSHVVVIPYGQDKTVSYVWSGTDFSNKGTYEMNPVTVPNGSIFDWTWSVNDATGDFVITLASGVAYMVSSRSESDGTGNDDFIDGGAGNDWIAGQLGDDIIYGGDDDDIIYGDDVTPLATDGNDKLYAGSGTDTLYGGGGNDELHAEDNDNRTDKLDGGTGDDYLYGGTGKDALHGDELYGGEGNDWLFAGTGGGIMQGGTGNDTYTTAKTGAGNDTISDESGDDVYILAVGGTDTIIDQSGNDAYHIDYASLRDNSGTIKIDDRDGVGGLFIDVNRTTSDIRKLTGGGVRATAQDTWVTRDGLCKLTKVGDQLVIQSLDPTAKGGKVLIQNFFSKDTFLYLKLPAWDHGPTNHPPVAGVAIAAQKADQNSLFNFTVPSDAFTDPDGDVLTLSARLADGSSLPAWLTFNAATGAFSGTPGNAAVGNLSVQVTATDPSGASASQTFGLTVVNVNDAPEVGVLLTGQNAQEGKAFSYTVPAGAFTDVDVGDKLTLSASGLPGWLSFDAASSAFSGTPPSGSAGSLSIVVTATDLAGASVSQTFILTVQPLSIDNHPPVAGAPIEAQKVDEDSPFNFTVPSDAFTDPDGDALTLSARLADGSSLPAWLTFNAATGAFSGTPGNAAVGNLSVQVTATDPSGASASQTFGLTVVNVNDPPEVGVLLTGQNAQEGKAFSYTLPSGAFTDVDVGDKLSLSASGLPGWLSFDAASSAFSGTPPSGSAGSLSIVVTATDLAGASVSQTFILTVQPLSVDNHPPVAGAAIAAQKVDEDSPFNFTVPSDAFTDPDGDALTLSARLADGSSLPAWLSFDAATGAFSGTPDNAAVGDLSVRVTATDPSGASASQTFGLTVVNVNDAPQIGEQLANQITRAGQAFSYTLPAGAFFDIDVGDELTLSAIDLPDWLTFDPVSGIFSGTPTDEDVVRNLEISVMATDLSGASSKQRFTLTVVSTNGNMPPVVGEPLVNQNAQAGQAFSYALPAGAFTDPDVGDVLTLSAIYLPDWLTFDPVSGIFSGTPGKDAVGTLAIGVLATDLSGETAFQLFNLTVGNAAENHAPTVGVKLAYQYARAGQAFSYTLPAGAFTDPDVGDQLSLSAIDLPDWLNFDPATGTFSGTPDKDAVGTLEVIRVAAKDLSGASVTQGFFLRTQSITDPAIYGTDGTDVMHGTGGDDILYGRFGDDILYGGVGNDTLYGEAGSDIYRFERGWGQDTVNNYDTSTGKTDAIEFAADIAPGDIAVSEKDQSLVLSLQGATDQVTVLGYFTGNGATPYRLEEIRFADGTTWGFDQVNDMIKSGVKSASKSASAPVASIDALVQSMASFAVPQSAETGATLAAMPQRMPEPVLLGAGR